MSNDVTKCIDILADAIAFEEEGIRFFTEKAEAATSELERSIFLSLAKDEQGHRAHLIGVRDGMIKTHNLSSLDKPGHDHDATPRQIFESALESVKDPYEYVEEDLEILQGAMEVERKGYTMYSKAAARMESTEARELFEHLAAEEQTHYELLKNTYEYIRDPEGWNEYEEGGMLDGG
ncbi:ferritin family protein [bacterium]|nr:ferritin family protein [bacterium]MBU1071642.1 ferritin family protein [bacterium]MBU1674625.1 ferritin family protein [bacterium]